MSIPRRTPETTPDGRYETTSADYLDHSFIGTVITFDTTLEAGVAATITGELRQLYIKSSEVHLCLIGADAQTGGEMWEHTVSPETTIMVPLYPVKF